MKEEQAFATTALMLGFNIVACSIMTNLLNMLVHYVRLDR